MKQVPTAAEFYKTWYDLESTPSTWDTNPSTLIPLCAKAYATMIIDSMTDGDIKDISKRIINQNLQLTELQKSHRRIDANQCQQQLKRQLKKRIR